LCDTDTRFSHTGNLRKHVQGHKVEIQVVRKGTLSAEEQRQVRKFYVAIIARHQNLLKAAENAGNEPRALSSSSSSSLSAVITASKKRTALLPPPPTRCPRASRKRDATVNKAQMRRDFGLKVSSYKRAEDN